MESSVRVFASTGNLKSSLPQRLDRSFKAFFENLTLHNRQTLPENNNNEIITITTTINAKNGNGHLTMTA